MGGVRHFSSATVWRELWIPVLPGGCDPRQQIFGHFYHVFFTVTLMRRARACMRILTGDGMVTGGHWGTLYQVKQLYNLGYIHYLT